MASPALSSASLGSASHSNGNPFDAYAAELRGREHSGSDSVHTPNHDSFSPPPTSSSSPSSMPRHPLESSIPESPIEEEASTFDAANPGAVRQAHRPSPLSQGQASGRARAPSASGTSTPSIESSAKPKKHGILRKLSGLNFLHHEKHAAHESGDLKASQVDRHNVELLHPRTGTTSRPTETLKSHASSSKPKFTVGEDSMLNSPVGSVPVSRVPSVDGLSIRTKSREPSISVPGSAGSPVVSQQRSPRRDHEDFIPRAPTRANSTFNFFRKNSTKDFTHDGPPARSASFALGETNPINIPGVHQNTGAAGEAPMSSLSRTLSKASLVGGSGWGPITEKLPAFDSLYTWKDANEKKIKLDLNTKSGMIGEGAGGIIRTARLKNGCRPAYHPESRGGDLGLFAVKTFRKQSEKESEGWYCQKLVREFRVHCALRHDNIVKLADICVEQKKFGDAQFVAVLDFCVGGDLFDLHYHQWNSIDQGVMSKVERNCVFKQLMFAVKYMHDQGIAHRDIKLENMLINGHGQMKLADFGTSNFTRGQDAEECRGFVGTDHSVPPEAFLSSMSHESPKPVYDGLKADIWACAVTWHILTWSNDEPLAALRAYPFGPEGADPDNKTWQKYMNNLKRYEPNKYIPGWDLYMERERAKHGTPPGTPSVKRQDSIAYSAASGQSGMSDLDGMFDTSDPNPSAHPDKDDLRDPMRKCRPFANGYPGSGFTAAKGMLDPDPATRWSAQRVIDDPFFALIDCCQKDSNPDGYDSSKERARRGLQKVHNHIRSSARKLMEVSKVEQERNQELVDSRRKEK